MLSVLYKPVFLEARHQFMFSKAMALGVLMFIRQCLPERNDVFIKWPNDIYADNRKICGILIENSLLGQRIEQSITGIGININEQDSPPGRVSLNELSGTGYDLRQLEKQLFSCLEASYLRLQRAPSEISEMYLDSMLGYRTKRTFFIEKWKRETEGEITGITPEGKLMLMTAEGPMEFGLKELSFKF
jgi:BirA family biotin operon repressor/biotin-[acetyl-CoA-carboxylase] ligase